MLLQPNIYFKNYFIFDCLLICIYSADLKVKEELVKKFDLGVQKLQLSKDNTIIANFSDQEKV